MSDIVTYFMTFGSEFAAALPRKVYDPVAWGALVGALLIGAFLSGRAGAWHGWAFAGATFLLILAVLTLEAVYLSGPVPRGDNAALAFIYVIGVVVGSGLGRWLGRRS